MVKNKGDLDNFDFRLIILKYSLTGTLDQVQILKIPSLYDDISVFDCSVYLSPTSNLP